MKKKTILGIVTIAICTVLILCELGASEIRVWGKDDNDYEHILSVRDNDIAPSILMGYTACTVMNKNGEIYTWGFDENGQLGEGKKTNAERRSPQKIWEGCSAICRNNCFSNVTMVIKDNDLYSWGSNIYGLTGTVGRRILRRTNDGLFSGGFEPKKENYFRHDALCSGKTTRCRHLTERSDGGFLRSVRRLGKAATDVRP